MELGLTQREQTEIPYKEPKKEGLRQKSQPLTCSLMILLNAEQQADPTSILICLFFTDEQLKRHIWRFEQRD